LLCFFGEYPESNNARITDEITEEGQMAVLIRPATMQDYSALAAIGSQNQALHAQGHPEIFQQGTSGFTEEYVRGLLENEQAMSFVAEEDEQVIGYAFVRLRIMAFLDVLRPHVVAEITDLVVTTQARGKGTGSSLFEAVKLWAKRQHAERLELTVWEFNKSARKFYKRLGMRTLSRTMSLPLH
jgi:diamine N-acetyltransferase